METLSGHESTSLTTYLRVLKRRGWIVALCAVAAAAVAGFLASRQPVSYQSTSSVYINKTDIATSVAGLQDSLLLGTQPTAETQANLAMTMAVAQRAVKKAGITTRAAADVLGSVSVYPRGTTDILDITITDADADTAVVLAGAYADAFTAYRAELDTRSVTQARQDILDAMDRLAADGRKNSAVYDTLEAKEQQLQTLSTLQTSRTTVILRPVQGDVTRIAKSPKQYALMGLALGLVLGLGLAFGAEALDTRVRSTSEVGERLGGLTLLARVPEPPKKLQKNDDLVMISQPTSVPAEAFRVLRTNLEFVRLGAGDVRTILITSAVEQEGKSTTSANLAVALARAGKRVALVDLDLRRPYLDRFFKLLHAQGLADVALGNATLGEAMQRIDLNLGRAGTPERLGPIGDPDAIVDEPGVLDVLTTGPLPPDPGEFVGSAALMQILQRLRDAYDMVVIDSPPVLRVGDALTLSTRADGVVVVAKLTSMRRPILRELRRVLEAAPAPKLGFVVTGTEAGTAYSGMYGAGYGYGDSYYTRETDRARLAGANGTSAAREGAVQ